MRNMPLLYMVNVTAKYMARLPRTKKALTDVQYDISNPNYRHTETENNLFYLIYHE